MRPDEIVEKERDCSRNIKTLTYYKMMVLIHSSSGNMVKSYLKKEERIAEKIRKFPRLYDKSNKGYKEKGRKKRMVRNFLF